VPSDVSYLEEEEEEVGEEVEVEEVEVDQPHQKEDLWRMSPNNRRNPFKMLK